MCALLYLYTLGANVISIKYGQGQMYLIMVYDKQKKMDGFRDIDNQIAR